MSDAQYKKVVSIKGQKISLKNTELKFNGEPVSLNEIHLHGNTTLNFERKSYSIDIADKIKFCEKGCRSLDAFYLISLSMDKNYFHNRLCFDLLGELDLFHLEYKYAEVKINGNSQGIYLMVQRPQDWSKKVANSPFILRRGLHHTVAKEKAQKDIGKETVKAYRHQFSLIYKLINQNSGEALYSKLNEILHVDDYLRWLALNYIIKNGDYSDELYFYIDPDTKRFRIIPWDYDDVFQQAPHEGMEVWRSRMDPNSLIFSSEDELDLTIAHDPYLYDKYKQHLTAVVNELSDQMVESVINMIYEDLSPLFASDAILQASSKDGYETSVERLQAELKMVNQYFAYMRGAIADK
jgi:spore coat protein H